MSMNFGIPYYGMFGGNTMFGLPVSYDAQMSPSSMANLLFWDKIPMAAFNYGGDPQICHVEPFSSSQVGFTLNPIAQQSWGIPGLGGNIGNPFSMDGLQQMVTTQSAAMQQQAYKNMSSQYINGALNAVKSQITKLQASEATAKDEDKPKIQEQIKKLQELEKQIKDLKDSKEDPEDVYQKATELYAQTMDAICPSKKPEEKDKADKEDKTDKTSKTDSGDKADKTDKTGKTNTGDKTDKTGKDGKTQAQGAVDDFSETVKTRVDQLRSALYDGFFVDSKAMNEALNGSLEDGSLVELALRWNDKISSEKGQSMIEAFMDKSTHWQAKDFVPKMADALYNRAEELGVCDEEFKAAYNRIKRDVSDSYVNIDDDLVNRNFNFMLQKIANKLGSKYGKASAKAS